MQSDLNKGMLTLTNALGDQVSLNTNAVRSYTPTGLGTVFSNTYSQVESYFLKSKSSVSQGIMQAYIKFGDVKSTSYQSFTDFTAFLSYQPLTLQYTIDSGTWYRDCNVQSMTKTEIGGTTIVEADRLNETFTIEFINPWYNNKTSEYKTYESDEGMNIRAKGFINYKNSYSSSPNLLLNSDFSNGFTNWTNENNTWTVTGDVYDGSAVIKSPNAGGSGNRLFQNIITDIPSSGDILTVSFNAKATKTTDSITIVAYGGSTYTVVLSTEWKRYNVQITITSGFTIPRIYFWNSVAGDNIWINKVKAEDGSKVTAWTPADSEIKNPWNYGYFQNNSTTNISTQNNPYTDLAKADITYLEQ